MLFEYGGGVSLVRIKDILSMPMVTIIRLLGAAKKRLNPEAVTPGGDVDENQDAAVIAMLEKRMKK